MTNPTKNIGRGKITQGCGIGFHSWKYNDEITSRECKKCGFEQVKSGITLDPINPKKK